MQIRDMNLIVGLLFAICVCAGMAVLLSKREKGKHQKRLDDARRELYAKLMLFCGYFQPLEDACLQEDRDMAEKVLSIWKKKMQDLKALNGLWDEIYRENEDILQCGREWLALLAQFGIMHDACGEIYIRPEQRALYIFDDVYELGDRAVIIRPAWYYEQDGYMRCIEQGLAKVEE